VRGSGLVTTERVVCLASPASGDTAARLEDAMADHDATLSVRPVGESLAGVDCPPGRTLGITLGGDGTFLSGVQEFAPRSIPFFGINTGTLGFLAGTQPADLEPALAAALAGEATVTSRQRYRVTGPGLDATGINEVTFERPMPENPVGRKVCRLDVVAGGEYVGQYEGSGIAVAAPTGSTAMALSAGGPVHTPADNHTLQVVPLQTNRLGLRPVVLDAGREVRLRTDSPIQVAVDGGRPQRRAEPGDTFAVTGAAEPALLVQPPHDAPFFGTLADTLGWGGWHPDRAAALSREQPSAEDPLCARARRVARTAVCAAGEATAAHARLLRRGREQDGAESHAVQGSPESLAEDARQQSEQIIAAVLDRQFPDHGLRTPADTLQAGEARTWLAAPLDGLDNFTRDSPHYAVSLALLDADPVAAAVAVPAFDEVFAGSPGRVRRSAAEMRTATAGSSQSGRDSAAVEPTAQDALAGSTLVSRGDPRGALLGQLSDVDCSVQRPGSDALALCHVAAGRADACLLTGPDPAVVAGGVSLLRLAGGRVTDADGEPFRLQSAADGALVASNGPLHGALLDRLTA